MLQLLRLEEHLQAVQQLVSRDQTKAPTESQPRPFPALLGCSPNSTHLLQGHSVYSNSNNPDLLTRNHIRWAKH